MKGRVETLMEGKADITDKQTLGEVVTKLRKYAEQLCKEADKDEVFSQVFWDGLCSVQGMLREFAYYCDTGNFLCEKKIEGYTLADILVWQVDHFKAYLDRGDDCFRYNGKKLVVAAFDIMIKMDKNPAPFIDKMKTESGTDIPEVF